MPSGESRTELGTIKIHRDVIASIASIAALEIEGVRRIGGGWKSRLREALGIRDNYSIEVQIDKHEGVRVVVPLVIKFGYSVPEVAARAQENIRGALEKMTNVTVKDVDINVRGIERGDELR